MTGRLPRLIDLVDRTHVGELEVRGTCPGERVAKYNRIMEIADAAPDVALHSF